MSLIDDAEYLLRRLAVLREAEELASQGVPDMVPDLRRLYRSTLRHLGAIVARVLGSKASMGSRRSGPSLEVVERLFLGLKVEAEFEKWRVSRLRGKERKEAESDADELARMTRQAAAAVKLLAEAHGEWSEQYVDDLGLEPWL